MSKSGKFVFTGLKKNAGLAKMMEKYIEPMEYYLKLEESGRDLILHHAPALFVLHGPAFSFFASDNCNIAATNICNYAHSLGLGTCFIGFVTLASRFNKKLCKLVELPKDRRIYSSLVIGYPKYPYTYTVCRNSPNIKWVTPAPDMESAATI
jgi:nitroreductase